jgi:hypothetical protein
MTPNSVEAEYVATWLAYGESVWLRKLIVKLFDLKLEETCIFYDNQSCIKLSVNPLCHDNFKHIEIKYHYIQEIIHKGAVKLQYIPIDEQVADVLTKPLFRVKLENLRDKLGVIQKELPQ